MSDSIFDLAKPVLDAIRNGNGWLAAALALVLVVTAARKYGAKRFPWLGGKVGGAVCNVLLSLGGMIGTALAAGSLPSWALALTAIKVSMAAAGGFTLIKELAVPALRWLETKAPAWLQPMLSPLMNLLLWAFEKRDPIATAEKAGADAVAAKPATGADGIVGLPRKFP